MNEKTSKPRKPIRRITAEDARFIREYLRTAALICEPPELTRRRLFIQMIPTLFALRKRLGYTFKQITKECNSCGLAICEPTVRAYYAEFAPKMQQECLKALEEMELMAKQIELQTEQQSVDSISSRSDICDGGIKTGG